MRDGQDLGSQYNIVVLGAERVGKSTLVSQFVCGRPPRTYKATIEDCYRTLVRLPDGRYKTVNIIDTAGGCEFPAMRELRIRSATAVIIVYAVSDPDSIRTASTLHNQVQELRGYDGVPITVVGNKCDEARAAKEIPNGIMEDTTCEHVYSNYKEKEKIAYMFQRVIQRCHDVSSWKVEVWTIPNGGAKVHSGGSGGSGCSGGSGGGGGGERLRKSRSILSMLFSKRLKSACREKGGKA